MEHISDLLLDTLKDWFIDFVKFLPRLFIAAVVLVVGFFIVRKIKRFVDQKASRFFPTPTLANLTISVVYVVLLVGVLFLSLKIVEMDGTIKSALAGAGIIGLGLAFAFKDIAANFISGIFLAFRRPFYKGDIIRVKDYEGFVNEVKLRDTTLKTYQGQYITIPNQTLFQNPITNYTRLGKRRADIKAGIPMDNDLEKAQEVATKALKNVPQVIYKDSQVLFREIKGNTTYFVAECWVDTGNFNEYKHFVNNCILAIHKEFRANNITVLNEEFVLDFKDSAEKILKN